MVSVGHADFSRSACAESQSSRKSLAGRPSDRRLRSAICKFLLLVRCNAWRLAYGEQINWELVAFFCFLYRSKHIFMVLVLVNYSELIHHNPPMIS